MTSVADLAFWRRAFLRQRPRRYALMQPPGHEKKYDDHRGEITDVLLARHLAGEITLAGPFAMHDRATLLPLDVDDGGIEAITALLREAQRRGLWAFAQFCPRPDLPDQTQRGYVVIPFADLVPAAQLQQLGQELISAILPAGWTIQTKPDSYELINQPTGEKWKIESRAHFSDTRIPLGRHTHTGRFGELLYDDQRIDIDADPDAALAALQHAWRENPIEGLPQLPAPPPRPARKPAPTGDGMTIEKYNQAHDIVDLLLDYGAQPAGGKGGLYRCPFHDDGKPSLQVYIARRGRNQGQLVCRCMSQYSNCPLAAHGQYDAFNVYCIGERLAPREAICRLNGRETTPQRDHSPPPPAQIPKPAPIAAQRPAQPATGPVIDAQAVQQAQRDCAAVDDQMSPGTRRVLQALQRRAGESLWTWDAVDAYASDAGLSERQTRRALRWLEEQGYVHPSPRFAQTTIYKLTVPGGHLAPGGHLKAATCESHDSNPSKEASWGGDTGAEQQAALAPADAPTDCTESRDSVHHIYKDEPVEPIEQVERREWHADLRPREAYTLRYGYSDMLDRCKLRENGEAAGAPAGEQQHSIEELTSPNSPPPPTSVRRLRPPTDPQRRSQYYKLLGAAKKKAGNERQARRLREMAAALLEETTDELPDGVLHEPAAPRLPAPGRVGRAVVFVHIPPRTQAVDRPPPNKLTPTLPDDDPWLVLQRAGLAAAECAGDVEKVRWYRDVLGLEQAV